MVDQGIAFPAGDDVQIDVTYLGSNMYRFNLWDNTTRNGFLYYDTGAYSGKSADFIIERPRLAGAFVPLRNFFTGTASTPAQINAAQAGDGVSSPIGMQTYPLVRDLMDNGSGVRLATPQTNVGQSFTDTWNKCG